MNGTWWSWVCVVTVPIAVSAMVSAADVSLPIEAQIVILPGTPATTPAPMASGANRPVPAPTTPSGRLPQYQLGPAQLVDDTKADPKNGTLRFTVTMPAGQLIVEVDITIDGKPYPSARERRIAQLLEQQNAPSATESTEVATDLAARLQRYRAATDRTLTHEEIDWWLTTAVEGPTVLWLKPGFQRFRADQRPVLTVLDRNHDGSIDVEELSRAEASLLATDTNRNDIVEFTELGAATRGQRTATASIELPRIVPAINDSDLSRRTPDFRLTVDFHSKQLGESRLRLIQISEAASPRVQLVKGDPSSIVLRIDSFPVMWEAVQVAGLVSDQISLGCVNDGYPWLPALDLNDDGRLTARERRQLLKQLSGFDTSHDGSLTADEAVAPFRIAIGLGPTVHRHLANIRSVHPRSATPTDAAPEWFTRMDRNKDWDLTRAEFPGTDEQFRTMDRDDDQLIDVAEAKAYDQSQPAPGETEASSVPKP